jgi:hypothetical protein
MTTRGKSQLKNRTDHASTPRRPTAPKSGRPLMGWAHPDDGRHEQFTHAVLWGGYVATCGATVVVIGAPWPEPPLPTPQPRCSICTQVVHGMCAGLNHTVSAQW